MAPKRRSFFPPADQSPPKRKPPADQSPPKRKLKKVVTHDEREFYLSLMEQLPGQARMFGGTVFLANMRLFLDIHADPCMKEVVSQSRVRFKEHFVRLVGNRVAMDRLLSSEACTQRVVSDLAHLLATLTKNVVTEDINTFLCGVLSLNSAQCQRPSTSARTLEHTLNPVRYIHVYDGVLRVASVYVMRALNAYKKSEDSISTDRLAAQTDEREDAYVDTGDMDELVHAFVLFMQAMDAASGFFERNRVTHIMALLDGLSFAKGRLFAEKLLSVLTDKDRVYRWAEEVLVVIVLECSLASPFVLNVMSLASNLYAGTHELHFHAIATKIITKNASLPETLSPIVETMLERAVRVEEECAITDLEALSIILAAFHIRFVCGTSSEDGFWSTMNLVHLVFRILRCMQDAKEVNPPKRLRVAFNWAIPFIAEKVCTHNLFPDDTLQRAIMTCNHLLNFDIKHPTQNMLFHIAKKNVDVLDCDFSQVVGRVYLTDKHLFVCTNYIAMDVELEQTCCYICLHEYEGDDMVTQPCLNSHTHHFHVGCIVKWATRSNTCPVCRREFEADYHKTDPFLTVVAGRKLNAPLTPSRLIRRSNAFILPNRQSDMLPTLNWAMNAHQEAHSSGHSDLEESDDEADDPDFELTRMLPDLDSDEDTDLDLDVL